MLRLRRRRQRVLVVGCSQFLRRRLGDRPAGSAVEADVGYVRYVVVDHGLAVGVCDRDVAEIVHRSIVGERAAPPEAAGIAYAGIAKSVIDAAIEADVGTPIARMPGVNAIAPAPIARSPKQAHRGWQHPRTRHPIVVVVTVGPITQRPDIAGPGDWRLHVD